MLNDEQGEVQEPGLPLTYGSYLRIPDLLQLQVPLSTPVEHDEMLFILVQQAQELWFKQILHELEAIIDLLGRRDIPEAVRLLNRVNRIARVLSEEVRVLQTMPPQDFQRFRHVLSSSSGFESEQFREVELASGLSDPTFLKLIEKHVSTAEMRLRWPCTLADAFRDLLSGLNPDPVEAVVAIYSNARAYSGLFILAETLSEYETLFSEWRFHHIKSVERAIGDRSTGTAGSSGAGYLGRTLSYRFFPELWEARNRLTAMAPQL